MSDRGAGSIPDEIVLRRDRDLEGRGHEIWVRRGLLWLVLLVPVVALLNGFGQRPHSTTASGDAATLKVYAPERVRAGLIYQVNPTNVGRRSQDVDLLDGGRVVAHVDRSLTVFP